MGKASNYRLLLLFLAIFIVTFLYFSPWQNHTANGDDLYTFKTHYQTVGLINQINLPTQGGKYRPIQGFFLNLVIDLFQHNLFYYFIFNVFILSICTFILALILDLILNSLVLSFLFSLAFGLSRFCYYEICVLTNGGVLEGLALMFFLLFLYTITKILASYSPLTSNQKFRYMLLGILYANLCIYTHERYISVFILIFLLVFSKKLKSLGQWKRALIAALAILSPLLNIYIKEHVFGLSFLMSTSNTETHFSFFPALSFFMESVTAIFQINTGPDYVDGISYSALPSVNKAAILLIVFSILAVLITYFVAALKSIISYVLSKFIVHSSLKKVGSASNIALAISLCILFLLAISTCIFTVRVEQRWLMAPLCILIVLIAIAYKNTSNKNVYLKYSILTLLIGAMIWVNYSYLNLGINNFFMRSAENDASRFGEATRKNVIHISSNKLYLWDSHQDPNYEAGLLWAIGHGYFFKFYFDSGKQIIFVDSLYSRTDPKHPYAFTEFDPKTSQIITLWPELKDITSEYIKDSLKTFTATKQ